MCTFFAAVQIGFQQSSYTVSERNESVRVCVEMTTGDYTVPVTLAVLNTGSAQSMYNYFCIPYHIIAQPCLCACPSVLLTRHLHACMLYIPYYTS